MVAGFVDIVIWMLGFVDIASLAAGFCRYCDLATGFCRYCKILVAGFCGKLKFDSSCEIAEEEG